MKITVHGSTGAQGGPVAEALAAAGHEVAGITRTPRTGDTSSVAGDFENQSSLEAAYARADAVFVHLPIPTSPDDAGRWVAAILGALAVSKVERVVFSTSGASLTDAGPDPMMQDRLHGNQSFYAGMQNAVPDVVALAPRLFLENLLLPFVSGPALDDGVLAYPLAADKAVSWISHLDVANAAVEGFDQTTAPGIYDLGLDAVTGDELAVSMGDAVGRDITYQAITPAEFVTRATPLFGPQEAAGVGALYEALATDHTLALPDGSQQIAARRLTVHDWAALHLST